MYRLIYATILPILLIQVEKPASVKENSGPNHIKVSDIPPPAGFFRKKTDSTTFGAWLRQVKLKNDKTVYLYNGTIKRNQHAQYAVLDIRTGKKRLATMCRCRYEAKSRIFVSLWSIQRYCLL